jgi:NitT/TauT family transport system substrate-binding protein
VLACLKRAGLAVVALVFAGCATADKQAPLRVYGNTQTLELAPVLLAADEDLGGPATVTFGGVPDLFNASAADLATNAETQALRQSVDHPDLRIIFTVSEGYYRIVARRSSGIAALSDLKGKKIATWPNTSSAYFLKLMLERAGLSEADVTILPVLPPSNMPAALASGEVDAVTIWEPEIETAKAAIGDDAIEFSGKGIYRELFNLHARAVDLADPGKRSRIVAYVRGLIAASERVRTDPKKAQALVAAATQFDAATIAKSWPHEGYPGLLVSDLLDVMVLEEIWVAKERNRVPRSRAELATLIDDSIVREALAEH